ncbi:MAG: AAA family ATPase [Candidatus Hydrothermae bacterium]|nr:AAA family ATPase [Candidatus Hydrothermae bacterium]
MLKEISVKGYKSYRDKTTVSLRMLTILSGANSSGKSSLIQPLLLLKQTLQTPSDPGPLKLDGPNVVFSRSEQMFWKGIRDKQDKLEFGLTLDSPNHGNDIHVRIIFGRKKEPRGLPSLKIQETEWRIGSHSLVLRPETPHKELLNYLKKRKESEKLSIDAHIFSLFELGTNQIKKEFNVRFIPQRLRCFLVGAIQIEDTILARFPGEMMLVEQAIRNIIHVPGLRGNPERAYPVRAVEGEYPGLFQDYVASLISKWQRSKKEKIKELDQYLIQAKLTWKVRARQRSDTEVELRVGRTLTSRKGGARDLVNIADTGFGVSQSLPVIVALLAAERGHLIYLEQPEIHLHPDAQVGLADLIVSTVNRGVQIIVETHSHLILLALQRAIAKRTLDHNDAILHWFQRDSQGKTHVSHTLFNLDGSFENPNIPVDFNQVSLDLMFEYLTSA